MFCAGCFSCMPRFFGLRDVMTHPAFRQTPCVSSSFAEGVCCYRASPSTAAVFTESCVFPVLRLSRVRNPLIRDLFMSDSLSFVFGRYPLHSVEELR